MEPGVPMRENVDLKSYAQMAWRRKWVILIPALVGALTAFVVTLPKIMRPVYESSSTLMVEFPQALSKELADLVANPSMEEQLARLESQIQSNEFLTKIVATTGMRDDPALRTWAEKNRKRYPDLSMDDLIDLKLIEYLRRVIRMSAGGTRGRPGASNIIQVSVQDYYPARARALVQNITTGIIEANRSEELRQVKSTGDFSATQLQEYQVKLKDAEARLEAYQKRTAQAKAEPTAVSPANLSMVRDLRSRAAGDLSEQRAAAQTAGQVLRAAQVQPERLGGLLDTGDPARMRNEARGLEREYARTTVLEGGVSGPGAQGLAIRLSRQVDAIGSALRDRLDQDGSVPSEARPQAVAYLLALVRQDLAQAREDGYDGQLAQYAQAAGDAAATDDPQYQRLLQEVQSYRDLQNAFVLQLTSSQISEAFGTSKVGEKISILEPAQHPLKPIRPKRLQIVLLAMIAGLVAGVSGGLFLEHHDPSFHDVHELEQRLRLPVLGTMPAMGRLARLNEPSRRGEARLKAALVERAVQDYLTDSPGFQEFRKLVLALLRDHEDLRSVMVTSARRGEGKSTTAAALALALARELPRERIILVDLDTRKPVLGAMFGSEGDSRVSPIERRFEESALFQLPLPNLRLCILTPGGSGPDELVTADNLRWLMSELRAHADRVVIDSPPNLPVPDALIIGPEVDTVLFVVSAGSTPRETVIRAVELQRQFSDNLAGVVMNNRLEVLPYYYHPSHYGYGYSRRG